MNLAGLCLSMHSKSRYFWGLSWVFRLQNCCFINPQSINHNFWNRYPSLFKNIAKSNSELWDNLRDLFYEKLVSPYTSLMSVGHRQVKVNWHKSIYILNFAVFSSSNCLEEWIIININITELSIIVLLGIKLLIQWLLGNKQILDETM